MNTAFSFQSAGCTHPGRMRTINQDAYIDLPDLGIWVVADGVGGHQRGDVASQSIVDAIAKLATGPEPPDRVEAVRRQLLAVNRELIWVAERMGPGTVIGSTVAALVGVEDRGVCLWAGDSRIYGFRQGHLFRLTRDHSQVEELVERGQITPEEARHHPNANVIYRAIGQDRHLEIDVVAYSLMPGDKLLLCTDGLTKELRDEEIAAILATGDCEENCRALLDRALSRFARDNVTVLVVAVQESQDDTLDWTRPSDFIAKDR